MENNSTKAIQQNAQIVDGQQQTPPAEPDNRQKVARKANLLEISAFLICCIVSVVTLITLLSGATTLFGKSVNIYNIFIFSIDVFSIKLGSVYKSLVKLCVSVFYIYTLVMTILNLKELIKLFIHICKEELPDKKWEKIRNLYYYATNVVFRFFLLAIITYVLSASDVGAGVYVIAVFASLMFLSFTVLTALHNDAQNLKKKDILLGFLFNVIRSVLYVVLFSVLAGYLIQPSVMNLSYGVRVIFGGHFGAGFSGVVSTFIEYLIKDVLDLAVCVIYVISLKEVLSAESDLGKQGADRQFAGNCIKLLILMAVSVVLNILSLSLKLGKFPDVFVLYPLIVKFIPAIVLCVAGLCLAKGRLMKK